MLKRVPTGPHGGWKWTSAKGYLYLGIAGDVYAFHLAIGRFDVTVESSAEGGAPPPPPRPPPRPRRVQRRASRRRHGAARRSEAGAAGQASQRGVANVARYVYRSDRQRRPEEGSRWTPRCSR
jgi:hypothetical protein